MGIRRSFMAWSALVLVCLLLVTSCGQLSATAPAIAATEVEVIVSPTTLPAPTRMVVSMPSPTLPTGLPINATDQAAGAPIEALSDEFEDAGTLVNWQNHATVEGWPSWIEEVDVNTTSAGHLYLVPTISGWFEDRRGVYLYKEVTGDFDVRTRVRSTGKHGDLSRLSYSLSGLMARAPRSVTSASWVPRQENWVFITTGYGDERPKLEGKPQIETKTTTNSSSTLWLIESRNDWVELRIVRVGPTFLMLYRFDDGAWKLSKRFNRRDLPATLQVGINAYSSGGKGDTDALRFNHTANPEAGDLVVRNDYVRFRRPQLQPGFTEKMASAKMSNNDWLAAVGE